MRKTNRSKDGCFFAITFSFCSFLTISSIFHDSFAGNQTKIIQKAVKKSMNQMKKMQKSVNSNSVMPNYPVQQQYQQNPNQQQQHLFQAQTAPPRNMNFEQMNQDRRKESSLSHSYEADPRKNSNWNDGLSDGLNPNLRSANSNVVNGINENGSHVGFVSDSGVRYKYSDSDNSTLSGYHQNTYPPQGSDFNNTNASFNGYVENSPNHQNYFNTDNHWQDSVRGSNFQQSPQYQEYNQPKASGSFGAEVSEYSDYERGNYDQAVRRIENSYDQVKDRGNELNLGINLDAFIGNFIQSAKILDLYYRLPVRPKRNNGQMKDSSVFCFDSQRLCFSVVWNKGRDKLETVAMIAAGDGTHRSVDEIIKNIHIFMNTITPGLVQEHRENLIDRMGMLSGSEIGNCFVSKPNGQRIRYEHARTAKAGLVVIASAI